VSVQIAHPGTRAALRELADAAPRSIPFSRLGALAGAAGGTAELRGELLDLWLATGAIDLHAHEPAVAGGASARPTACPVARWHAVHGGPLTNRWHQEVRLDEPVLRAVLARLDGTRTITDVARDAACPEADARAAVAALAAAALLVA
jgi:hypothetical protein